MCPLWVCLQSKPFISLQVRTTYPFAPDYKTQPQDLEEYEIHSRCHGLSSLGDALLISKLPLYPGFHKHNQLNCEQYFLTGSEMYKRAYAVENKPFSVNTNI